MNTSLQTFDPLEYKLSPVKKLTDRQKTIKNSFTNLTAFFKKVSNKINSTKYRSLMNLDPKTSEFKDLNAELQKLVATRERISAKRKAIRAQFSEFKTNAFMEETRFLESTDFSKLLDESENLSEKYGLTGG